MLQEGFRLGSRAGCLASSVAERNVSSVLLQSGHVSRRSGSGCVSIRADKAGGLCYESRFTLTSRLNEEVKYGGIILVKDSTNLQGG